LGNPSEILSSHKVWRPIPRRKMRTAFRLTIGAGPGKKNNAGATVAPAMRVQRNERFFSGSAAQAARADSRQRLFSPPQRQKFVRRGPRHGAEGAEARWPHRRGSGGGVGAGLRRRVQLLAEVAGQIGHHAQLFGNRRGHLGSGKSQLG